MPSIRPDDAALHPGQVGAASPELFSGLVVEALADPDAWQSVSPDDVAGMRRQLREIAGAAGPTPGGALLDLTRHEGGSAETGEVLAAYIRQAIDVDLSFAVAGIDRAVYGDAGPGLLNVLAAVKAALNGAEEPELAELLSESEPSPLVDRAHAMSEADASVIRAFWVAAVSRHAAALASELVDLGVLSGG